MEPTRWAGHERTLSHVRQNLGQLPSDRGGSWRGCRGFAGPEPLDYETNSTPSQSGKRAVKLKEQKNKFGEEKNKKQEKNSRLN